MTSSMADRLPLQLRATMDEGSEKRGTAMKRGEGEKEGEREEEGWGGYERSVLTSDFEHGEPTSNTIACTHDEGDV